MKGFGVGLLIFMLVVGSGIARADVVLDQEYWDPSHLYIGNLSTGKLVDGLGNIYGFGRAQTFTVGLTGTLDSIQVRLTSNPSLTSAQILATSGGAPLGGFFGSTILASSSSMNVSGDTVTIDFSAANLSVNVGEVFAIELLDLSHGGTGWYGTQPGGYAGGSDYYFNVNFGGPFNIPNWTPDANYDNDFRTFVNTPAVGVPEPTTMLLLGSGLLGLWGFKKKFRK